MKEWEIGITPNHIKKEGSVIYWTFSDEDQGQAFYQQLIKGCSDNSEKVYFTERDGEKSTVIREHWLGREIRKEKTGEYIQTPPEEVQIMP